MPRHALSIIRTRGNVHTAIAPQFLLGICTGHFQRFVFVQNEPGTSSFPLLYFALNEPGTFLLFFARNEPCTFSFQLLFLLGMSLVHTFSFLPWPATLPTSSSLLTRLILVTLPQSSSLLTRLTLVTLPTSSSLLTRLIVVTLPTSSSLLTRLTLVTLPTSSLSFSASEE